MHKYIRAILAAIVLVGIVLLGRNGMAWAGNLPSASGVVPQSQGLPAAENAAAEPGSVRPPPVVVPPIQTPGTYSVGGVCTFRVIEIANNVALHADLLPFATLGKRPPNIASYLAGVCRAIYTKVGAGVIDLGPTDGQVEVCFAAVPDTTSKIYVYNDKTWTALDTTVQDGLACAPAQQSGKYAMVTEQ